MSRFSDDINLTKDDDSQKTSIIGMRDMYENAVIESYNDTFPFRLLAKIAL